MEKVIDYDNDNIVKLNQINLDINTDFNFFNEWLSYNYMEQIKKEIEEIKNNLNTVKSTYSNYINLNEENASIKIPEPIEMNLDNIISVTINTKSGSLNIREDKNTDSNILTTIPKNSTVQVIERYNDGWSKIKLSDGKIGYALNDYLKFQNEE